MMAVFYNTFIHIVVILYLTFGLLMAETIDCNNATFPCSSSEFVTLECTEDTLCEIICSSPSICINKKLICKNNQNCQIYCQSTASCKSTSISCGSLLCDIYAQMLYSLQYATITAMNDTQLNISCQATNACNNAIINGQLSSNTIITSTALNAFKDITIYCPQRSSDGTKRCHFIGTDKYIDEHNTLTIHAQNSWNDLDIDNYYGIASGFMFCNIAQCHMIYGLWNCVDITNPCYVPNDNILNKICLNERECYNQVINCNATKNQQCNIVCYGRLSCVNATINCGQSHQCNVICSGEVSCSGLSGRFSTEINCPLNEDILNNQFCRIICGTSINSGSCYHSIINGNNRNLEVHSIGLHGISQSMVYCGKDRMCTIWCNAYSSCHEIEIYALNAQNMQLLCEYEYDSCSNPTIYCPPKNGDDDTINCMFTAKGQEIHNDLRLYCINSWDDIYMDITQHIINRGIIYCTEFLNESCIIENNTKCICPPLPTPHPTVLPMYINTTFNEMPSHDSINPTSIGLLIAFAIAFCFVICGWATWYSLCRTPEELYTPRAGINISKLSNDKTITTMHVSDTNNSEWQQLNSEIA